MRTGKKELCPICNSKKYVYTHYREEWGLVEQYGYCDRCGYVMQQAYSPVETGFYPIRKRGYRDSRGVYHASNKKARIRMKRKFNIKYPNEQRNWLLSGANNH